MSQDYGSREHIKVHGLAHQRPLDEGKAEADLFAARDGCVVRVLAVHEHTGKFSITLNDVNVILTLCALAQSTSVRCISSEIYRLMLLVTSFTGSSGGGHQMSPLFGAAAISNNIVAADQA